MTLNELSQTVHEANKKWWQDITTGEPIKRNKGELLALIHSELSEAFDGHVSGERDDKLPARMMAEVEQADAFIRALDYAAGFKHDLNAAALKSGVAEFMGIDQLRYLHSAKMMIQKDLRDYGLLYQHSLVSQILEAERKSKFELVPELLVKFLFSIVFYCDLMRYDLQGAYTDKTAYNQHRVDHQHEARRIAGGKQF